MSKGASMKTRDYNQGSYKMHLAKQSTWSHQNGTAQTPHLVVQHATVYCFERDSSGLVVFKLDKSRACTVAGCSILHNSDL